MSGRRWCDGCGSDAECEPNCPHASNRNGVLCRSCTSNTETAEMRGQLKELRRLIEIEQKKVSTLARRLEDRNNRQLQSAAHRAFNSLNEALEDFDMHDVCSVAKVERAWKFLGRALFPLKFGKWGDWNDPNRRTGERPLLKTEASK